MRKQYSGQIGEVTDQATYGSSAGGRGNDVSVVPDSGPELLDLIDRPLPEVVVVGYIRKEKEAVRIRGRPASITAYTGKEVLSFSYPRQESASG